MKSSQIFRAAAKAVDCNRANISNCCCRAIYHAAPQVSQDGVSQDADRGACERDYFDALFRPDYDASKQSMWWGQYWSDGDFYNRDWAEVQSCRVLALLFAAEVAESEGL